MTYQKTPKNEEVLSPLKMGLISNVYTFVTIIWVSFVVSFIGNWDLQIVVFY